jgi:hypothetical protein
MSHMMTQLTAQAEARGADLVTLRALIEEASDLGASRALARLGLADDHAPTLIGPPGQTGPAGPIGPVAELIDCGTFA